MLERIKLQYHILFTPTCLVYCYGRIVAAVANAYNLRCKFGSPSGACENSLWISTTNQVWLHGTNQDVRTTNYSYNYAHRECSWEQNNSKHIIQLIVEQQHVFDKRILAQQPHCSLSNNEPSSPDGSEFASLLGCPSLADNITYFAIALESQHYSLFL